MDYQDHGVVTGEADRYGNGGPSLKTGSTIARTRGLHTVATIALDIATRVALIAGVPDGEDSAGRAKLRLPTAQELAQRSTDIAAELWAQFEARGWMFSIPLPVARETKQAKEPVEA